MERLPPEVFDASGWRKTLCMGTTGTTGDIELTETQQRDLYQHVAMYPGRVWLISGLTAMAMHPARWSNDDNAVAPEKLLDAMNFAPDGRSLDTAKRDWLAEVAKADGDVAGLYPLKPQTDA